MTIDRSTSSAPSSINRDDLLSALETMRRHLELTDALSEHGEELERKRIFVIFYPKRGGKKEPFPRLAPRFEQVE